VAGALRVTGSGENMARRRHSSGRRSHRIHIGAAGGAIGAGLIAYNAYQAGGGPAVVNVMTGYNPADGSFHPMSATAMMSLIVGAAISMVGSKLKLNRYIPKPFAI